MKKLNSRTRARHISIPALSRWRSFRVEKKPQNEMIIIHVFRSFCEALHRHFVFGCSVFWLLILYHFLSARCVVSRENGDRKCEQIYEWHFAAKRNEIIACFQSRIEKYEWIIANHKFVLDSVALLVAYNFIQIKNFVPIFEFVFK